MQNLRNIRLVHLSLLLLVLGLNTVALPAQTRKRLDIYSDKMQQPIACEVLLPEQYNRDNSVRYPVVYLLHGHGGNQSDWFNNVPHLGEWANRAGLIFVSLDGKNSWYFDSPLQPELQYETFVTQELPNRIDSLFRTIASPKARAIAGLSMGGHGALWLATRHPEVFGAAGSMSGGVDIRPFDQNWNIKESLGEKSENPERWELHTVINAIERLQDGDLALIFDCGTSDFFLNVNRELHKKLLERGIRHDFIERPGNHDWDYWSNAIDYQLLFFLKFFNSHHQ